MAQQKVAVYLDMLSLMNSNKATWFDTCCLSFAVLFTVTFNCDIVEEC